MIVEYECWKCGVWHEVTFDSMEQIESFVVESGSSVRNVNTLKLILEGKNNE